MDMMLTDFSFFLQSPVSFFGLFLFLVMNRSCNLVVVSHVGVGGSGGLNGLFFEDSLVSMPACLAWITPCCWRSSAASTHFIWYRQCLVPMPGLACPALGFSASYFRSVP